MKTLASTLRNIILSVPALILAFCLTVSCGKQPEPDTPDTPDTPGTTVEEYALTLESESEFYQVSFPEKAKAGETVGITVTPVENVFIDAVKVNSKRAEKISDTEFTFEMPKRDAKISVQTSGTVTVEESQYFTAAVDKEIAAEGETVTVTFYMKYVTDIISSAVVNGKINCRLVATDFNEYTYSFEMPEGPATVVGQLDNEYKLIQREWDDNCVISMLDCINNSGEENEFCSQVTGGLVHYRYECSVGYDVTCTVTGLDTGTDYTGDVFWSLAEDNHLGQDCWAFYMPEEGVLIKAVSKERDIYNSEPFIGEYQGYWITVPEGRIVSSDTPSMQLELCGSSAYFVTSDDANAYDFSGIYSVNNGKIQYSEEEFKGSFGIYGNLLENDFAFITIDNLLQVQMETRRYYLVSKNDFSFVCATDTDYQTRYLVEADQNGSKSYYFMEIDTKSLKPAEADFLSGNTISGDCVAIFSINGAPYVKYTYSAGSHPVFQYCGKEAGSYTSDNGETLTLDGFGNAVYNGTEGTYTIDANIVTFNGETKLNINTATKTFTVINESTGIQLASSYSTSTAWIGVDGNVSETGMVIVKFDSAYNGVDYKEGYALVKITYMDTGKEKEMIGASSPYFIDEANRTVTISNVLQGNGGWGTTKKDIVLNISEDGKMLTFVDEVIFSTSSPYIYCYGQEWAPLYSDDAE